MGVPFPDQDAIPELCGQSVSFVSAGSVDWFLVGSTPLRPFLRCPERRLFAYLSGASRCRATPEQIRSHRKVPVCPLLLCEPPPMGLRKSSYLLYAIRY